MRGGGLSSGQERESAKGFLSVVWVSESATLNEFGVAASVRGYFRDSDHARGPDCVLDHGLDHGLDVCGLEDLANGVAVAGPRLHPLARCAQDVGVRIPSDGLFDWMGCAMSAFWDYPYESSDGVCVSCCHNRNRPDGAAACDCHGLGRGRGSESRTTAGVGGLSGRLLLA